MAVGIEKLNLYAGRLYLDLADLARARDIDPHYITHELMCEQRSVLPLYEDVVTLAVNAARPVLDAQTCSDIELLIVATESGVDGGKPISTWVHRFCGLKPQCRNFEVKHACYGFTGALKMAVAWVASGTMRSKKALVINTDLSRCGIGHSIEPLGGACAVAALVGADARVLRIDSDRAGYWTNEIADNLRPTARVEIVADLLSVYSYLDALEGAYDHYEQNVGPIDYDRAFRKHIYHAPFPAMTLRAHQTLVARAEQATRDDAVRSFRDNVEPGLQFAKRIGSSYGGSTMVSLLGLLDAPDQLAPGDRISLFSYGGGCQGEFYDAEIGTGAHEQVASMGISRHLDERMRLSVAQYEALERARETAAEAPSMQTERGSIDDGFAQLYAGQELLVLKGVTEYVRDYEWS